MSERVDVDLRRRLAGLAAEESDVDPAERAARAVWSHLAEPGDAIAGGLVTALGAEAALQAVLARDRGAAAEAGIEAGDWPASLARWLPRAAAPPMRVALDQAARCGARLLVPGDPSWPEAVLDLGDSAPLGLWVRGDPATLAYRPSIAVVGARAASAYGEHVAADLAGDLAARGCAIVSGAAYGIDGAAHRAALGAGGPTVAFLAGGLDRPYPAGHAGLLERIARAGAVVSEVPCGAAPTKWRFLARNRVIAAISQATVVVEAGWRSGSLNTAGHAAALGRPLGAVPGPVTSAASAGCHRLLREYDAQCITSADEALELLGWSAPGSSFPLPESAPTRSAAATRVLDALSARKERSAEDIGVRSGLAVGEVMAELGLLALDGVVRRDGEGWRRVLAT